MVEVVISLNEWLIDPEFESISSQCRSYVKLEQCSFINDPDISSRFFSKNSTASLPQSDRKWYTVHSRERERRERRGKSVKKVVCTKLTIVDARKKERKQKGRKRERGMKKEREKGWRRRKQTLTIVSLTECTVKSWWFVSCKFLFTKILFPNRICLIRKKKRWRRKKEKYEEKDEKDRKEEKKGK